LIHNTSNELYTTSHKDLFKAKAEADKVRSLEDSCKSDIQVINQPIDDLSVDAYCHKSKLLNNLTDYLDIKPEKKYTYSPLLLLQSHEINRFQISHTFTRPFGDAISFENRFVGISTMLMIELNSCNSVSLTTRESSEAPSYLLINFIKSETERSNFHILSRENPQKIDITQYCRLSGWYNDTILTLEVQLIEIDGDLRSHLQMAKNEILQGMEQSTKKIEHQYDLLINSISDKSSLELSEEESKDDPEHPKSNYQDIVNSLANLQFGVVNQDENGEPEQDTIIESEDKPLI